MQPETHFIILTPVDYFSFSSTKFKMCPKEKWLCILVHICQCHHCIFQTEFRHFPSITIFEWLSQWLDGWMTWSFLFNDSYCLDSNLIPKFTFRYHKKFSFSPKILIFPNKSVFPLVYTSASNNQTHSTILLIFCSRLNLTWEMGAEEHLLIFFKNISFHWYYQMICQWKNSLNSPLTQKC